jgi:vacuolar-type H+-ATPase subunit D/Vma8
MSLQEIYKKINTISPKMELSQVEIELSLVEDINKLLDSTNAKRKQLTAQGLKISEQLLGLTVDYNKILSISIDAANKAKELGIADAEKLFRVRGSEAKDYSDTVGKVSNLIANSLHSI